MTYPICRECKHSFCGEETEGCLHPKLVGWSPVSGAQYQRMDHMRSNEKKCGKRGKYFEPRPKSWLERLFTRAA